MALELTDKNGTTEYFYSMADLAVLRKELYQENETITQLRAENAILSDINADCMRAIGNNKTTIMALEAENARLTELLEETSLRTEIEHWLKMLSTEIFREPDFVKARALLEAGGMTLDGLSASNMRHVLTRLIEHDDKARATRVSPETDGAG